VVFIAEDSVNMLSRTASMALSMDISSMSLGLERQQSSTLLHGFNGSRQASMRLSRLPSLDTQQIDAVCAQHMQVIVGY